MLIRSIHNRLPCAPAASTRMVNGVEAGAAALALVPAALAALLRFEAAAVAARRAEAAAAASRHLATKCRVSCIAVTGA